MVTPTLQMRHAAMLVTVEEQKKFLSRPHTLSWSSYRSSHFSKNICSSSLNSFPFFCFFTIYSGCSHTTDLCSVTMLYDFAASLFVSSLALPGILFASLTLSEYFP